MMENEIDMLPLNNDVETKRILKQLSRTSRALAELKGIAKTMPNQNILINAIMINEAKTSSSIENIVTTHDEIYKAMVKQVMQVQRQKRLLIIVQQYGKDLILLEKSKL